MFKLLIINCFYFDKICLFLNNLLSVAGCICIKMLKFGLLLC